MRWPWQRTEHRASATDALVSAIVAAASNQVTGDHRAIAAVEIAAGLYASAFASARVVTDDARVAARLTPAFLSMMARSLIRRGAFLAVLEATPARGLELQACGSWDVHGAPSESEWWYRCDLFGPSGSTSRTVPSAQVIHVRYSVDPSRPWRGLSPLESASSTAALASNLEQRLAEETGASVGRGFPFRSLTATIRPTTTTHSPSYGEIYVAQKEGLFWSKVWQPDGARVRPPLVKGLAGVNIGSVPIRLKCSKRCVRALDATC